MVDIATLGVNVVGTAGVVAVVYIGVAATGVEAEGVPLFVPGGRLWLGIRGAGATVVGVWAGCAPRAPARFISARGAGADEGVDNPVLV